jgi:hypothetical protein
MANLVTLTRIAKNMDVAETEFETVAALHML